MFNGSIYVRTQTSDENEHGSRSRSKKAATKRRRLPPEVLTNDEVTKLMRACSYRAPTGIRNRALIALLYRTGLRINEALSLYPKDLELDKGIVRVLNGKGGRSRTIGIDPGAAGIVQRWLDVRSRINIGSTAKSQRNGAEAPFSLDSAARPTGIATSERAGPDATDKPKRSINGRHPVFCTLDGRRMSTSYVRVMLKRLAYKAGIDKRVHAHGFRHTHAAQLRAEGLDIAIISRQLGHTNITTTARYLDHLAPTAVIEAMRSRGWNAL